MKTDWSTYQITYDGKTYDLHYRNAVDLIACEGYVPNSPTPTYPSPILSAGGNIVCGASSVTMPTLRSLSDGTKDTLVYLGAGVWRHTQNIGHIASYGGETITTLYASTTAALTTGATVDYQLATPVVSDLTLGELKTYPRQTTITQDSATKGTVTAGAYVAV